jgi:processive 1,2-diacylglycerol beta-glucosyltransferase
MESPGDFQLIVIAGKNERLKKQLVEISRGDPRIFIHGFRTDVHHLMQISELMITKSGGLTISEGLAMGIPMIIYGATPGQEERNAEYLSEHGAGFHAATLHHLDYKVRLLLDQKEIRNRMRGRAAVIARPFAARDVIAHILSNEDSAC